MVRSNRVREINHPQKGFGRVMVGLKGQEAQELVREKMGERDEKTMRLKEKWEKTPDLGLGKGKLDEMFQSNPRKAEGLVHFLEATEQEVKSPRVERILEGMQTSSFLSVTPQDIVKVFRIAYPNAISQDLFNFWGMTSVKDSIYKLETLYSSVTTSGGSEQTSVRGQTANTVTYENYADGRYPTEFEKETISVTTTDNFTGTLDYAPVIPYQVKVYVNDTLYGVDNGTGVITGTGMDLVTPSTIVYSSGVFDITFAASLTASVDTCYIEYAYNSEDTSLFYRTGSVLLNLVAYDFRAHMWPLALEWSRMTEEVMGSKLGMGAKDTLIAGAADVFKQKMDEYCVANAIKASNWTTAVPFNADFAAAGADDPNEFAQGLLTKIQEAELKTFKSLGRYADKTNMVVGVNALPYLQKHKRFVSESAQKRIGIHKVGVLDGRDIYLAPLGVITETTGQGKIYLFGKGNDPMTTDAVVSVGTWKANMVTDPVELKNFNSQMGMAMMADLRVNNKNFATKVEISNLDRSY
jgi:hypothetical protein